MLAQFQGVEHLFGSVFVLIRVMRVDRLNHREERSTNHTN